MKKYLWILLLVLLLAACGGGPAGGPGSDSEESSDANAESSGEVQLAEQLSVLNWAMILTRPLA